MDDMSLIAAAREGNETAFGEIVQRYQAQVAATVIGMLGHCDEADEVGQDVFIRFYKHLDKFRGEASLSTYLTRIAINLSLNELKRRKRRLSRFFNSPVDELVQIPDRNDHLEKRDICQWVQHAIQRLEPNFRAVIVLRLIDGYSTQETAEILKIPLGTVLSRLARAQAKLKDILIAESGGAI